MRKVLVTSIVSVCLVHTAFCQSTYGIKAGANFANVTNIQPGEFSTEQSIGFNAGLITQIQFGKMALLRPEILYSLKGYKYPQTSATNKADMHLHYINVPILAGFQPFKGFSILAGPEFGFLARANSRYDDKNHNVSKNFKKFDIGIDAGLSYHLKKGLGIEVRYNYGFEGLTEVTLTDQAGNVTGREKRGSNRVFQAGLFYVFAKKR